MRFTVGNGLARLLTMALAGSVALTVGCEALWGSLGRDNPVNCVHSSQPCGADEICDPTSQVCVSAVQLDSVTPTLASSQGGTTMTLRGQRLLAGARVFVDGEAASEVSVRSSDELGFTLPSGPRGRWRVAVAVENPSGHRGERSDLFSYFSPSLIFSGRPISIGGQATEGAFGDWNRDGFLDLAILASPTPGVQIFLGDGQGNLSPAQGISIGSAQSPTNRVVSFDADRDGKIDLAVLAGTNVTLLFGDGLGGFPTRRTIYTTGAGRYAGAVSARDYDGDGRIDLAIADATLDNVNSTILLLHANADGSYTPSSPIDSDRLPTVLTLADLTGDGKIDLLVGFQDVRLTLWRNDGGDARSQQDLPTAGCSVRQAAVGDLNRDGLPDLLLNCDSFLRPLIAQSPGQLVAKPDFLASPSLGTNIVLTDA